MCPSESIWLKIALKNFICVDDSLLLLISKEVKKFLEYLSIQQRNIKFTSETYLSFSDINISRDENSIVSSVYRKPTYTTLTLDFNSYQ